MKAKTRGGTRRSIVFKDSPRQYAGGNWNYLKSSLRPRNLQVYTLRDIAVKLNDTPTSDIADACKL